MLLLALGTLKSWGRHLYVMLVCTVKYSKCRLPDLDVEKVGVNGSFEAKPVRL